MRVRLSLVAMLVTFTVAGCAAAAPSPTLTPSPVTIASSTPAASATSTDPWADDLAQLDAAVRANHPSSFTIHPESDWVARLAELKVSLPAATPDEQIVQVASLVGLLDTHSWLAFTAHQYGVLVYPFADGWFVVGVELVPASASLARRCLQNGAAAMLISERKP